MTPFHVIMSETATSDNDSRYQGRVKWFNNKAGYGFVTVVGGESDGKDIFVHHSGVIVQEEQYKYLVQGEYVEFELRASDNEEHPYQAGNVRGVKGGMLMCETRMAMRRDNDKGGDYEGRRPRQGRNDRNDRRAQPRRGGGGPRDDQWGDGGRKPRGKWNVKPSTEDQ